MATINGHATHNFNGASTTQYHTTSLFGGAITVDLPTNLMDASTVRPVPDTQEVFVQATNTSRGSISIIFDILEYVSAASDIDALNIHLSDIITDGDDAEVVSQQEGVALPKFPEGTRGLGLSARVRRAGRHEVGVLVTLVRLEFKETDLVITVNVEGVGEEGVETIAAEVRERIWASLEVKDWTLFV